MVLLSSTRGDRGQEAPEFKKLNRERRRRIAIQKWGPGYLLVLPAILLIVAMMLYPLIQTLVFSVSNVQLPLFQATFTGIDNFLAVFKEPNTGPLVVRTLTWVVGTVALRFILGFLAAIIFNAKVRGTVWMRILVVLPWMIPSVVAANLWRWVLQSDNGVLNETLRSWGLPSSALVDWLGNPHTVLGAVIVAYSWAGFPFVMLLILAGMQGISEEQYEAAKVDGANWWQLFRYITVPSVRPVLVIALILEIVSAVNSFDTIEVMTGGGPANESQIWSIGIYTTGFQSYNFGGASAMSVLMFVVAIVLFTIYGISSNRNARLGRGQGE
jgi:multiple sugar transport system permease protein